MFFLVLGFSEGSLGSEGGVYIKVRAGIPSMLLYSWYTLP